MEAILFEMSINSISMAFVKDVPITVAVMIDKRYDNDMYLVEDFISMPVPEDVEIKLKKIGIIETVQNSPFMAIQAFTKSNYIDVAEAYYNNKPLSFYSYDSIYDWKIDKGNKFIITDESALSYFITSLWNNLNPNLLKIHEFDGVHTIVLGKQMKVLKKMLEWFNRPNSMYIDDGWVEQANKEMQNESEEWMKLMISAEKEKKLERSALKLIRDIYGDKS